MFYTFDLQRLIVYVGLHHSVSLRIADQVDKCAPGLRKGGCV